MSRMLECVANSDSISPLDGCFGSFTSNGGVDDADRCLLNLRQLSLTNLAVIHSGNTCLCNCVMETAFRLLGLLLTFNDIVIKTCDQINTLPITSTLSTE